MIDAIGSVEAMPPVPGLREHTVTARKVLSVDGFDAGHKVVVIGGGLVGAETADYLAVQGHDVTIVEMMPDIMMDGEASPKKLMLQRFAEYGVNVCTSSKVKEMGSDYLIYTKDDKEVKIEGIDTIINAMGRKSDTSLAEELKDVPFEVLSVGDAREAKSGYLGIREGFEAGISI